METAISYITNFVTSKAQIQAFEDQAVASVKEGVTNPLTLQVYLKSIIKASEGILKRISEDALTEAQKYEKGAIIHGAKVEVCELATKYDYSGCGDLKWDTLNNDLSIISESKKDRETFLKTIKESMSIVDEETGETWRINPPIKSSTTGIKVTIK